MTLGSYDGIEIVQYTYDITDEMVQEQIDAARQDAATEKEKSGPSTTGDIVYVTLRSSVKDVADSEESEDTYFTIGDADYGEDFDAALTGVSEAMKRPSRSISTTTSGSIHGQDIP
ncbi:MAG: hypothetical protein ACLTSZ_03015 [Lachnospiraceae bacterium]